MAHVVQPASFLRHREVHLQGGIQSWSHQTVTPESLSPLNNISPHPSKVTPRLNSFPEFQIYSLSCVVSKGPICYAPGRWAPTACSTLLAKTFPTTLETLARLSIFSLCVFKAYIPTPLNGSTVLRAISTEY